MFPSAPRLSSYSLFLLLGLIVPSTAHADTSPAAKTYNHGLDARLLKAVEAGTEDAVKQFLRDGADPNTKETDQYATPVLGKAAGAFINLDIIKDLIAAGADVEGRSSQGATPLMLASIDGHSGAIEILLKAGAKVDATSNDGITPLMYAASAGEIENVKLLMKAGANVNAHSATDGTPLIYGCAKTIAGTGKLEIIKMLVEAGANVGVMADNGKNAVTTADAYDQTEIASYLREIFKRDAALFDALAAAYNDRQNPNSTLWNNVLWNNVKAALVAGANPRFSGSEGRTGLMFIAYGLPGADDETIKTIVTHSDLNAQDGQYGATALHLAVNNNLPKLAELLIQSGASLHLKTKAGQTPLDMAIANKNERMVQLLRMAQFKEDMAKVDALEKEDDDWTTIFGM